MSIVPPRNKPKAKNRSSIYTFEDFCILVPDGQKADLIDGVIYMASPDKTDANDLNGWLYSLIRDFVDYYDLGRLYFSRVAFRLGEKNGPEPDLGFVRKDRLHLVRSGFVDGRPDLALEIVSPDSVERDYVKKRNQFEQAGVPEYWIVDELTDKVTLLRLGADGKYREVRARKGILRSQVLQGFWLKPEWLWQDPQPSKVEVLALILGGRPI